MYAFSYEKEYPTDIFDAEWTRLRPYLHTPKAEGRPRTRSLQSSLSGGVNHCKHRCRLSGDGEHLSGFEDAHKLP